MVGYEKPSGPQVIVAGNPLTQELKVENATNMYPRRLVKKGTTDAHIVVCTAGATPLGVLGFEAANKKHQPATIDTAYAQNAMAPVHNGQIIVTLVLSTDSVVKGDALVTGNDGKVRKAASIAVAVPSGSTTVTSNAAQPDLTEAGSLPPGGPIVAHAEESQDASGGDKLILARWQL